MSAPLDAAALAALARPWGRSLAGTPDPQADAEVLTALSTTAFHTIILEALQHRADVEGRGGAGPAATGRELVAPPPATGLPAVPGAPTPTAELSSREAQAIAREAGRSGVDPALLVALRRAENGRPGREFGVLAVPAPGLTDQARVAANTIRNAAERFQRQGGDVVDPVTGRYTESFLRYFSARYAPLGAANDPGGLNRFHARNLIALYRRVSGGAAK